MTLCEFCAKVGGRSNIYNLEEIMFYDYGSVGTHANPHLDETIAIAIARLAGGLPLSAELSFLRREDGGQKGRLDIGFGGGRFDEHKKDGRLEGECSARLVAEAIGIARDEKWMSVIEGARLRDTTTGWGGEDLSTIIKNLARFSDDFHSGDVVDWTTRIVHAFTHDEGVKRPVLSAKGLGLCALDSEELSRVTCIILPVGFTLKQAIMAWFMRKCHGAFGIASKPRVVVAHSQKDLDQLARQGSILFIGPEGQVDGMGTIAEFFSENLGLHTRGMKNYITFVKKFDKACSAEGAESGLIKDPKKIFQLANVVGRLQAVAVEEYLPFTQYDLLNFVFGMLDASDRWMFEYHVLCPEEVREKHVKFYLPDCGELLWRDLAKTRPSDRKEQHAPVVIAVAYTDLSTMSVYLRDRYGVDVYLQKNRSQNLMVTANTSSKRLQGKEGSRSVLDVIAEYLVAAECAAHGVVGEVRESAIKQFRIMRDKETSFDLPGGKGVEWYYAWGSMILNGSDLSHEATPTCLSMGQVFGIIALAVRQFIEEQKRLRDEKRRIGRSFIHGEQLGY